MHSDSLEPGTNPLDSLTDEQKKAVNVLLQDFMRKYARIWAGVFMLLVVASIVVYRQTADTRKDVLSVSTDSRVQSVRASCGYDEKLSEALKLSLDKQIAFIRRANEAPPPTTEERVAAIQEIVNKIPDPGCKAREGIVRESGEAALESLQGK